MARIEHLDPSTRFVRSLDGEYFMVREAAEMLGVKHTLLRSLLREDQDLGPSFCAFFGKVKIYLYTREDIDRINLYFKERKKVFRNTGVLPTTGRPRKWTTEQRAERQRLYSQSHYYRKRLAAIEENGIDGASVKTKIEEIMTKIKEMEA